MVVAHRKGKKSQRVLRWWTLTTVDVRAHVIVVFVSTRALSIPGSPRVSERTERLLDRNCDSSDVMQSKTDDGTRRRNVNETKRNNSGEKNDT